MTDLTLTLWRRRLATTFDAGHIDNQGIAAALALPLRQVHPELREWRLQRAIADARFQGRDHLVDGLTLALDWFREELAAVEEARAA